MRSDEEINAEVERQLQGYKDLRARLNLPPLTDDDQSRQSILAKEQRREAAESSRQDHELQRKKSLEAWNHRVLAKHEDLTIVAKMGQTFSQTADGQSTLLPSPAVSFAVNEVFDLDSVSRPVVDGQGYAWTRRPVLASFSSDGSRLSINWELCAHEGRYGWEYSHAIAQRTTWERVTANGATTWRHLETMERSGLQWAHEDAWT